ncbi:hypothetical protein GGP81_003288 [Salinibacter ruber]|uniref:hypothetical protein n=1 Tax=Salinibacter ruber TaxID=146919 RepID=UPI002167796B|nr:hypothetical protein [Salinibacter ruber]MCS3956740.1 hypothetical protein [Salinibacter ruber]
MKVVVQKNDGLRVIPALPGAAEKRFPVSKRHVEGNRFLAQFLPARELEIHLNAVWAIRLVSSWTFLIWTSLG